MLYGTAISPVTSQPVRHLWVADATFGICRMDPDLDTPGPSFINLSTCPFNIIPLASLIGGPMVLDPATNFLYFVDDQRVSQGVFKINYSASGDNGNGLLDLAGLTNLAGASANNTLGGVQTGCALPGGNASFPNSISLDPLGNLWVGFAKNGTILRFNNPGSATAGLGTCSQFVQQAATVIGNHFGAGLAWIGHDLYGASGQTFFVIHNADTVCASGINPACSTANGSVAPVTLPVVLPLVSAMVGDQVYPALNGNNLYIGTASNVSWLANVTGGANSQSLAASYIDPAQFTIANVGGLIVDSTDPANLVIYTGDDPSAASTAGAGRWFRTTQTAAAPAAPGAPLNVVANVANGQATISWSPAQSAQPVTSYTVHNNFASNEIPLPDVTITPAAGSAFPATSATIGGAQSNTSYQFQVLASNAQGSSPYSLPSNMAPVIPIPDPPTSVVAVAGDTQAAISWNAPLNNGGLPITGYTVTAVSGGSPTGISVTIPATASTQNAVVSGLTNGVAYTFTVHATNAAGSSQESAPSNSVTPLISNVPTMKILVSGPVSVNPVPALVTYQVTVTNTSLFPINTVVVNNVLSTTDGAFIIAAHSDRGFCTAGGSGTTVVACGLGSLAPGASTDIDIVVQMQRAQITMTSTVTASDAAGHSLTFKQEHRTTTPPGTPPPPGTAVISLPISGSGTPTSLNPFQQGTLTWTVQNTGGVTANNVALVLTLDTRITILSVVTTPSTGADPLHCDAPIPGLINTNLIICEIATLGGPKASAPVTSMKVAVNILAPGLSGLQLIPSGTVSFDGIDSSNPTATIAIRVH